MLRLDFFVNKIASLAIRAVSLVDINSTLFGFIFGVELMVAFQLMTSVGKLASFLVGTVPDFHKPFAQLGFLFFVHHRRLFESVRRIPWTQRS